MDQDKVSVLLAVPAGEVEGQAARETVQSIASQSYPASLIETLQVQYITDVPGGRTAALNAARDQAKGEFLVQTTPGVTWDPSKLERQVLRLREGGENAGAGSAHRMSVRDPQGRMKQTNFDLVDRVGLRVATLLAPPWKPGALLVRSEVMNGLGPYRHIDQQVWEHDIRLAEKGHRVELLDEDLAVLNGDGETDDELRRALTPKSVRAPFLKRHLDQTDSNSLIPGESVSNDSEVVLAALHVYNDDLETGHTICQKFEREHKAASYWHGVIHRREPDFRNAEGWFGRADQWEGLLQIRDGVGDVLERVLLMPEYGETRETAFALKHRVESAGIWEPAYFVDMCRRFAEADESGPMAEQLLEEIQEAEMVSALDWTYRMASN